MSLTEQHSLIDIDILRAQLKEWEAGFRASNGRKPGRADIKQNTAIAAKYKQYDRLAKRSNVQLPLPPPAATPQKSTRHSQSQDALRERSKNALSATPRKTPSKSKDGTVQNFVQSPAQEPIPTPAFIRNALGPTPQKDGHVLGIFDIVSGNTPTGDEKAATAAEIDAVIAATPSKGTHITSSDAHFSRTPQSVGKRYFLDSFAGTPLKRKREDDAGTSSASRRKFATPSFLRRSFPLASIGEDCNTGRISSGPALFRKRGLSRSLSSIIQGLKKQEDEAANEEWDILREIEEEDDDVDPTTKEKPHVAVEDSQTAEMPLGPDRAPESDEEDAGGQDAGITRKPWKKKGLKRQTRRVTMRPVLHRAKKADEGEASENEDEAEVVPETQLTTSAPSHHMPEDHSDNSDHHQGDGDNDDESHDPPSAESKKSKSKHKSRDKDKSSKSSSSKEAKDKDESKKKKPRKVNPDAHANFRRLKIKNKNSKANGRGRRFGGRR